MANCWDFMKCGKKDVCPCIKLKKADGYLGGMNAGRACMFVLGTCCCNSWQFTEEEKRKVCGGCKFHERLKEDYGAWVNKDMYEMYTTSKAYFPEFYYKTYC